MRSLKGRIAVVTGAASGIGRGLAVRFAAEGMKVVLADVDEEGLHAAVAEITGSGAEAIGIRTDVRHEAEVQELADQTIRYFGAVHVVCNNAGVSAGDMFAKIPLSTWNWVVDVNLYGVIHGCRIFLPLIREQGEGHIVNTGSAASFEAFLPTFAPYVTSKFAVLGLTESLDLELRSDNEPIGVSILAPGSVKSQMVDSERNRPSSVPGTEQGSLRAAILDMIRSHTNDFGLTPAAVAAQVVEAILQNKFFVLTDPELSIAAVDKRLAWMQDGPAPAVWSSPA